MKFLFYIIAVVSLASCGTEKKKEIIRSDMSPAPVGPYSQAIKASGFIFVSGQIGMNVNGVLDSTSIENECSQSLNNIKNILEAAGTKMDNVVKVTIYLTDLQNFKKVNEVYKTFFSDAPPARETIEVKALPKLAHVEISVIAY